MKGSGRRALGAVVILAYLGVYIGVAASLLARAIAWPWPLQALAYAAAGIIWVVPLRPVFVWMGKS